MGVDVVFGLGVIKLNEKLPGEPIAYSDVVWEMRVKVTEFLEQGIAFSLSQLQEDVVCQGAALHVLLATGSLEVREDI